MRRVLRNTNMGQSSSHPAQKSPSAAFGRLRIDSPRPGRPSHRGSTLNTGRTASLQGMPAAWERSPLLGRELASVPSDVSSANGSPPLALWIGPALVCALAYALYNIFIKKGSASIHPVLGGVILQFVAALLGILLLSVLVWRDGGTEDLQYDLPGVQWAICAGVAVGSAEILSFIVSGMGVQAMQSIPIIIGGSVLFGTVLGYSVLQEMLTYRGWLGVVLIAAGIALVGTDPGGAGSVH